MDQQPNYRRRRLGVAIAALALLAVSNHDRPSFGVLSIDMDEGDAPRIAAEWAPTLETVATVVALAADEVFD